MSYTSVLVGRYAVAAVQTYVPDPLPPPPLPLLSLSPPQVTYSSSPTYIPPFGSGCNSYRLLEGTNVWVCTDLSWCADPVNQSSCG